MKRAAAVIALSALVLAAQAAAPASACGCGGPAPQPGTQVSVDRESALVRWNGSLEEILMQLDMRGDTGETGLVVPTPTPAKVTSGDASTFVALEAQLVPETVVEWDWWGGGISLGAGAAPEGGGAPTVLDRVQLGPIEATTLAAADATGLTTWLDENGYALSPALEAELGPYVDMGWSFVALKLTSTADFDGALDPIRFSFASDSLVYPLRMSHAAKTAQTVRLYVLGDHRTTITGTDGALAITPVTFWAGRTTDPTLMALGKYLTAVDLYFADPASQITDDLAIDDASNDDAIAPTVYVTRVATVLGIPVGPLVVVGALLLLVVGIVIAVRVRRNRAQAP
ncbi:MAG: DUF2330 domain-containing protein [Rhodoglobus sp.]